MMLTVIDSPACLLHNMGPEHPECPQRLYAINDRFIFSGLEQVVRYLNAVPADKALLTLAHSADYVEGLFAIDSKTDFERRWLDDDTVMTQHTLRAALHAAGAAKQAIDCLLVGEAKRVFCSVRPPGHHASRAKAAGFCFFNNVAIAAKYALEEYPVERVAIVDFDVHHGDGTEDIVTPDPRIMLCSSFQHPLYPFSGDKPTPSHIINTPLEAAIDGEQYHQLIEHWWPALDAFAPQLVIVSAGFDAHVEDELAHLKLRDEDFAIITKHIVALADKHANGRIVSMLEGGYALDALARSVEAHLRALG